MRTLVWFTLALFPFLVRATCPTDTLCEKDFQRCYKFVTNPTDFYLAETDCKSLGGHLVSISNAFEGTILEDTAESMFAGFSDYWIGANNILTTSWSWTDGTQWNYVNWGSGQPTNQSQRAASASLGSSLWSVTLASSHKPYVCELPLASTNTSHCPECPVCPTISPLTQSCPTLPPTQYKKYCDDGWVHLSETKSCYKQIYGKTFSEAEQGCISLKGHLASIHSATENKFIAEYSATNIVVSGDEEVWIGLYRIDDDFYWTDKSKVDFLLGHQSTRLQKNWRSLHSDACGSI